VRVYLSSKREKRKVTEAKKSVNAYQTDKIRDQNDDGSNFYQADSAIIFISITTIPSSIYLLPSKPSVIVT